MDMWKRVVRVIGGIFLAIPLLFVGLNLMEYQLGIAVSWNPFDPILGSVRDTPMRFIFEGVIIFGPIIAIAAFLLPHLRIRWKPDDDEIAAIGISRVGGISLALMTLAILVLAIMGIYFIGENLPCILGAQVSC